MLIADGHHRYGISRTYRDEVRAATGRRDTAAEQTLAFVGELVGEQLSIEAIHRLYTGVTFDDLRAHLARSFELAPAGPAVAGDAGGDGAARPPRARRRRTDRRSG